MQKLLQSFFDSKKLKGGAIGGGSAVTIAGMVAAGVLAPHVGIVLGICAAICPAIQIIFQGIKDLKSGPKVDLDKPAG